MEFPGYTLIETKKLIPYLRNSRLHSEAQVEVIANSIKTFKFLNPIIIGKKNQIVAGHGRLMAAQKLGIEKLPCIDASHLTEKQIQAYVIADNRIAEQATWDYEILKVELDDLRANKFDTSVMGFDSTFMKTLASLNTDDMFTMNDVGTERSETQIERQEEEPTREPSKTTDGYAEFTLIMEVENRDKLLSVINKIMSQENLEKKEHALMMMVLEYAKKL